MRTLICRLRRRARPSRSRNWRGPAPCSKSRLSRYCRQKEARPPGQNQPFGADLPRPGERSEDSSHRMGKAPKGRRRASAAQIPWWAWAWPAAAWLILLLTPFLQVRGFIAALAGVILIATVFAAVYHAELIAHRTGEPFGTLVLALAVTVIEVALIVSVMLGGGPEASTLARDTVFAAVMIICNALVGLCLLLGGIRHYEQGFQAHGASGALAVLAALVVLCLVLPNFTVTTQGPLFSAPQLIFVGIVSLVLYGTFVFVQTVRHPEDFLAADGNNEQTQHHGP